MTQLNKLYKIEQFFNINNMLFPGNWIHLVVDEVGANDPYINTPNSKARMSFRASWETKGK